MSFAGDVCVDSPTDVTRFIAGQDVLFNARLDGIDANREEVRVEAGGVTRFGRDVGSQRRLTRLETDTPGTTQFGRPDDGAGVIVTVTTIHDQLYRDDVLLNADTTLVSIDQNDADPQDDLADNNDNVIFEKTITARDDNQHFLAVKASDVTRFEGNVGTAAQRLESLTTDAPPFVASVRTEFGRPGGTPIAMITGSDQTYNDSVLLRQDTTLTATSGNIIFNGFVDAEDNGTGGTSNHGLTVNTPNLLNIAGKGDNIFNFEVGGDNQDSPVFVDSDDDGLEFLFTDLAGGVGGQTKFNVDDPLVAVQTTLNQEYNDPVLLLQDTILISTAGSITFDNFVDAADNGVADSSDFGLTVNTPHATLGNNVFNFEVGGDNQDGLSTRSDEHGLKFLITDDPAVGVGGQTRFNVSAPLIAVTTDREQEYNDAVLLMRDTILTSTGGSITFDNRVDAADDTVATFSTFGLTVNTPSVFGIMTNGNNVFNAEVGRGNQSGADPDGLEFLITDDPIVGVGGQTKLNVDSIFSTVRTTGHQVYNDAVLLMDHTLLTSRVRSITFNNFVDAADNGVAGTSAFSLTVNTPNLAGAIGEGNNVFNFEVGGDNQNALSMPSDQDGLQFLITDDFGVGGQTKFNVAAPLVAVLTTLNQEYNDPVLLMQDTILTSTAGSITFDNFVDAADNAVAGTSTFGLTVNTPHPTLGNNIFNFEVGGDNQTRCRCRRTRTAWSS